MPGYLESLLASLPGMVYRCNNEPGWPMTYASEGALELTGYPSSAFNQQNPFLYAKLIHPDDREMVWREVQAAVAKGLPFTIEYRIHDHAGHEKWVWERGQMIPARAGEPACLQGFIQDISARRERDRLREQQAREKLERERDQKAESLSRMASAIAHHFNNKLQTIIGCLEVAKARLEGGSSELHPIIEDLTISLRAAFEAAQVSRNMLIYLGKTVVERKRLDLCPICREVASHLCGAEIVLEMPDTPVWIHANTSELREALIQLVRNAIEAKPGGIVRILLRLDVCPGTHRHRVSVEIADEGPGVPAEIREQIFEPFFTTKFTGRGMGLPMAQGIAHKLGGYIEVADNPEGGALFRLVLPLAD